MDIFYLGQTHKENKANYLTVSDHLQFISLLGELKEYKNIQYEGEVDTEGDPCGNGKVIVDYIDGIKVEYEGTFLVGIRHGLGKLFYILSAKLKKFYRTSDRA